MKASNAKILIVILIIGLLSACGTQPTEAPASQPTETVVPVISSPVSTDAPTDTAVIPTDAAPAQPTEAPATAPAAQTGTVSFANDILPILQSRCINCHGGDRVEEGLNMKSYSGIMTGSDNGPVITAGDPANSLLVELVSTQKMPKKGPKLTPPQIQLIIDWVTQGALDN
jgi:mono/diheme cytochrome c family protein